MSNQPRYYRRNGKPYKNVLEWGGDFEKQDRIVKQERLWWGGFLSTVWLGIDYSFATRPHKPLIFETMLFPAFGWGEIDTNRYSTETEAREGHEAMKKEWSSPIKLIRYFIERFV